MKTILIILACAMMASCATLDIQRRRYRDGFYINNSSNNHAMKDIPNIQQFDSTNVHPDTVPTPPPGTTTYFYNYNMEEVPLCKKDSAGNVYKGKLVSIEEVSDVKLTVAETRRGYFKDWSIEATMNTHFRWTKITPTKPSIAPNIFVLLGWIFLGVGMCSLLLWWPLVLLIIPGVIMLIIGYKSKE